MTICESLNDSKEYLGFADRFIYHKSIIEGIDWIINLVKSLQQKGFNAKAISKLLTSIIQNKQVWDFVSSLDEEIQNNYWQNIYPIFYNISVDEKIFGVEMLMKYNRFFTAIDVCSHFTDIMPTKLLTNLLQKGVTEEGSEKPHFRQYDLQKIFETLDTRNDVERSMMINLEWLYIPFLDSYGIRRSPKLLEEELAKNPEFFIDVLKLVYIPKDKIRLEEEKKGLSDEMVENRAKQAYHLLHAWKRIPGMREDNSIDDVELRDWIKKVRMLAEEVSRLDVADMEIGKVLAQYPEEIPEWPQEKIFQIIEEINTDSLKRNYSSALFNKRSFSSRPAFAGGDIERDKAAYFKKLYNDFKNKYPNVAEIFKYREEGYLRDAKRIDEDAEREKLDF